MFLAGVMEKYKEEIICDLAEYYSIYDSSSHPIEKVAIFVKGLRKESRLMQKLSGVDHTRLDLFLAGIFDNTNYILWSKTKDGQKGANKPESILKNMLNQSKDKKDEDFTVFNSSEDFENERKRLIKEAKKGG